MKILYFGPLKEETKAGEDLFHIETKDGVVLSEVIVFVLSKYKSDMVKKIIESSAICVNLEYIDNDNADNIRVYDGDEVAFIPPVSSG